jgi:alkylhydroperoxidase family enzyme
MPNVHVPDAFANNPSDYVWSHYAPEIGAGASAYIQAVYTRSLLSLRELEAARMRTAQINGCVLCMDMRSNRDLAGFLEKGGVDPRKAVSARGDPVPDERFYQQVENWRDADCFSARERLVIEYADRMGSSPRRSNTMKRCGPSSTSISAMPRLSI